MRYIKLNDYGKFKNKVFEISPFTVFYGKNESGKTTLFDALFEQICAASAKRGGIWTRLNERYGINRDAASDYDGYNEDAERFMALFAIRSGNISIESDKKTFAEEAAKKLFSSGIDVNKIYQELEKRSNPSKNSVEYKKQIQRLKEIDEIKNKLHIVQQTEKEAIEQRNTILANTNDLKEYENKLKKITEDLALKDKEIAGLKQESEFINAKVFRSLVSEYVSKKAVSEKYHLISQNKIKEYDSLTRAAEEVKIRFDKQSEECQKIINRISELDKIIPEEEKNKNDAELLEGAAKLFISEAEKLLLIREENNKFKESSPIHLIFSWLIAIVGIGVAIIYGSANAKYYWLIPAAIVAALWYKKNHVIRRDYEAEKKRENGGLQNIITRWGERFDKNLLKINTVEKLIAILNGFRDKAVLARKHYADILSEREQSTYLLTDNENKKLGLELEYTTKRGMYESWLSGNKCASRDEYIQKANEKQNADIFLAQNKNKIDELIFSESCAGVEALLSLLDNRVKESESKYIDSRLMADMNKIIANAEKTKHEIFEKMRLAESEIKNLSINKAKRETEFKNVFDKIPQEIANLRNQAEKIQSEINQEENTKKSARLAAKIFSEMSSEYGSSFEILSNKTKFYLNKIIPNAELSLSGLSDEEIKITDSSGSLRYAEHLSSGTKDCFMLSARLVMAKESFADKGKIMIFDEPFLKMDNNRIQQAVKLVYDFYKETNCQIVFLTKEDFVLNIFKTFSDIKIVNL